jgi:hypothetical protein
MTSKVVVVAAAIVRELLELQLWREKPCVKVLQHGQFVDGSDRSDVGRVDQECVEVSDEGVVGYGQSTKDARDELLDAVYS